MKDEVQFRISSTRLSLPSQIIIFLVKRAEKFKIFHRDSLSVFSTYLISSQKRSISSMLTPSLINSYFSLQFYSKMNYSVYDN